MPFKYIPECISHAKWYISSSIIMIFLDLGLCLILLEVKRGTLIIHLFFFHKSIKYQLWERERP